MLNSAAFAFIFILFAISAFGQSSRQIVGTIVDHTGHRIANADVTLRDLNEVYETRTDAAGSFVFEAVSDRPVSIEIIAQGFETANIEVTSSTSSLTVTLSPRSISEHVTVVRTDTRLDETASSIVALTNRELETTAAVTLDDRLRQVPGVSLFRRAGSRTANPTTQGVSLRAVGASGASRALVLADGISINDPFGGWVYWGRAPSESISQVEVLRGTAGDLYGGSAIGGVVSIVTRRPGATPALSFETSYGTQNTPSVSLYASGGLSDWAGAIAAEVLNTDGFIIVAP